jgi:hypothetical protein
VLSAQVANASATGVDRSCRCCLRRSGGDPWIAFSIGADRCGRVLSLATGEPVAAWTSKNLRGTRAQQPASTIRPPANNLLNPAPRSGLRPGDRRRRRGERRRRSRSDGPAGARPCGRVSSRTGRLAAARRRMAARRAHRAHVSTATRSWSCPVPGARTGTPVSSTCRVSLATTWVAWASTSGCSAAASPRPSRTSSRSPGSPYKCGRRAAAPAAVPPGLPQLTETHRHSRDLPRPSARRNVTTHTRSPSSRSGDHVRTAWRCTHSLNPSRGSSAAK